MPVNYDDIEVNDTVYFEVNHIENHDLYWTVKEKLPNKMLNLVVHEMGWNEQRFVSADDVKYLTKQPKN